MQTPSRKTLLSSIAAVALISGAAFAQQNPPIYQRPDNFPKPIELTQTPQTARGHSISESDVATLRSALEAAKRGDVGTAHTAIATLNDPIAKKVAIWALADTSYESMSFFEIDQARRDLAGWPRGQRRQLAAEKLLETSGQAPAQIIAWFGGAAPQTAEGAMALASAYQQTGRVPEAKALIKDVWRNRLFEADAQRSMLARFGSYLTQDDHVRREDMILYGQQGPAARDMLALLPPDHARLAQARMAFRSNSPNAAALASALPASMADHPGLAFEKAASFRRRGMDTLALSLVDKFPREAPFPEMATRIWDERYALTLAALKAGDSQGAYRAAANTGLTVGADAAEAEFYAGWLALTRLNQPKVADGHFAAIERIGSSPITRGRAFYWRGRANDALGDTAAALGYYRAAARYNTTFYGQLAAEKVDGGILTLARDPVITQADRARFEARDAVRAARLMIDIGNRDLFRAFVLALDDVLPTAEEQALLVDMVRGYGDQDTSMKVIRTAAQRGFILTDRGYPMRTPPQMSNGPEPALVLGITRQESGFDPNVRSGPGATGMMQLMPGTATIVARGLGEPYSLGRLFEPEYNMRLGTAYLGQMVNNFSGSYPMGVAAYNAGPGRPAQWVNYCGDPRAASTDPIDFIECIPFSETRNYVQRVMEGMIVYRARLNGGSHKITLSEDLKRGSYRFVEMPAPAPTLPGIGATMAPIPNP